MRLGAILYLMTTYLLAAANPSAVEDERAVGRLDKEYQQAVKNNDAATMDRILADGFVLVTGLGKVYTKTDLLEEARSRRTEYERQEDSRAKGACLGRHRRRYRSALGQG